MNRQRLALLALPLLTSCQGSIFAFRTADGGSCTVGSPCAPDNQPCRKGTTECGMTGASCRDVGTTQATGSSCGSNSVCAPDGGCVPCQAGLTCAVAGAQCRDGVVDCRSGAAVCVDQNAKPAGTPCDGGVCDTSGQCGPCHDGDVCNPSACTQGVLSCVGGAQCTNVSSVAPGAPCSGGVCVGSTCVQCDADAGCSDNPSSACRDGRTVCNTSGRSCVDDSPKPPGTGCVATGGGNGVCDGNGACGPCQQGMGCTTNPSGCRAGAVDCSSGMPSCKDDAAKSPGAACTPDGGGAGVCDGTQQCVACTQSAACANNPTAPCKAGVTDCTSGTPMCNDGAPVMNGTPCRAGAVCSDGTCVGCDAGASCVPVNVCHLGQTSCMTGSEQCVDTSAFVDAGSTCGVAQVCSPGGTCIGCDAGTGCFTNPGRPCRAGVIACGSGVPACVDAAPTGDGTACGAAGQLCVLGACGSFPTCLTIHRTFPDAGTGLYVINPSGADGGQLAAYCDMDTSDGGWTLCARTHPVFTGVAMLTTVWGTVFDGTQPFGIGCDRLLSAEHPDGGNGDYQLTGVRTAYGSVMASIAASAFSGSVISINRATSIPGSDPLWTYLNATCMAPLPAPAGSCTPVYYSTCSGHTLLLQGDAHVRPTLFTSLANGPGPGGCGASYDQLWYGSDGVDVNYNSVGIGGSTTTSYTGTYGIHYRHGCCTYGYYTTDESATFPQSVNLPVFHWVR